MKHLIMTLLLTASVPVLANNPGLVCVASNKNYVLIEPQKRQVRVFQWAAVVDAFTIIDTKVRFMELAMVNVKQTTYGLEDNYSIVVEIPQGSNKGAGYSTKNGQVVARYYSCSESDNIVR